MPAAEIANVLGSVAGRHAPQRMGSFTRLQILQLIDMGPVNPVGRPSRMCCLSIAFAIRQPGDRPGLLGDRAALIVIFRGSTQALIALYAVGVFTSFTLSQASMVRRGRAG